MVLAPGYMYLMIFDAFLFANCFESLNLRFLHIVVFCVVSSSQEQS